MKIHVVSYRFGHHYSASGYNRLAGFLPCTRLSIPSSINQWIRARVSETDWAKLKAETGLLGYFPESKPLEMLVRLAGARPGRSLFHFIYPENTYYFTALRPRSTRTRLVATYHQPVEESRQFILKTDPIRRLDAVVLMSESQREFFEPLVDRARITVIPHGIDLEFFQPATGGARDPHRIIVVGSWLRDFGTMAETLRILERRRPDIACDVVSAPGNRSLFAGLSNVTFHAGISDAQLLVLYGRASVAVLPLHGAAANNALLEAMACGLPIVATDLPAVREYTCPAGASYVRPSAAGDMADAIDEMLARGAATLSEIGAANRAHADRYSWQKTAQRTMAVYRSLE